MGFMASSPGGSNRYGKKILWNKSLIFLAKVKGGQQLVGGQVCGYYRCSVSTAMPKLNLFLAHQKMFSQHILLLCSGLEELHFTVCLLLYHCSRESSSSLTFTSIR